MADPISAAAAAFATAAESAYVVAVGGTAIGASYAAAQLVYAVAYGAAYLGVNAVISMGLGAIARAQVPEPESAKSTRRQARPERSWLVGGPSRISGAYMHRETNENYLGVVLALCEGRLASISGYYLNDDTVTINEFGIVAGREDGLYLGLPFIGSERVVIKTRLGLPEETYYSDMAEKFASTWPSTARGDGIASLMMIANHGKKENFNKIFPNGEPIPSVVAQAVCYDWRDETQDREDESTWKASANPVVWLVFVEWYRHGRNWDRCIAPVLDDLTAEADYCDGSVATSSGTEPRYRCAGNYLSNTEPDAIRTTLLSTFDGWLSFNGKGQLVLKAGRYVEPTFILTGEHITGYTWRAFQTDEEACNELVVSYVSPEKDFTEVECDAWRDEADILATGRVRTENLQLTWVSYFTQARRLAKRKMSRLNAPRRGQIRTTIHGLNGLGERYIRVQNPELSSMADVVLEVMNVEVDLAAAQVVFDVILADENIDDWNPATEEGGPGGTVIRPPGEALDPPTIDSVEVFSDEAGQPRLRVTAFGPARDDLNWRVGWRIVGDTAFIESTASDLDPSTPVLLETGLVPQGSLEVIVGYETGGGTLVWMDAADAEPVNTLSAPLSPTELAAELSGSDVEVTWRNPSSASLSYLKVFRGTTNVFGAASDISGELGPTGLYALQTYTDAAPAAGTYYYWVVAYTASDVPSDETGPETATIFEAETVAILAAFTTPADDTRALLVNSTVVRLKDKGLWTILGKIAFPASADSQAGLIDWKAPAGTPFNVTNAPVFTADRGFTGATSARINTATALDAFPNLTQDSNCAFAWIVSGTVSGTAGLWGQPTQTQFRGGATSTGNMTARCSDIATFAATGAATVPTGLYAGNRSGSAARQGYKNGSVVYSDTQVSAALQNEELIFMDFFGNSAIGLTFGCVGAGGSLTGAQQADFYSIVHDYMTAVGAA